MASLLASMKRTREWATPTLKSSAFLSRGVLTPEEFVQAGDELVYKCPTWSWEGGDPVKAKSYLPKDKQYLVTRNVPCQMRVAALENSISVGGRDDDIDEGDWLVSHIKTQEEVDAELEEDFDILDEDGEVVIKETPIVAPTNATGTPPSTQNQNQNNQEEDEEYADMADFEDDNVMEDEAVTMTTTAMAQTSLASGEGDNLQKVRTYDLSITYDKYYQTPRVWIMGYSHDQSPLTGREMMQDVMSDYANRTVTIEQHPHVAGPHASIHPCQHGAVMKTIVRNLTKGDDGENAPSVELYIFIFLKFVSSIIPTINYDFTMDVTASTKK
eukprot:CAMPEP_0198285890 /NCGR_PEP_ID=MMETSP1449-20131203/5132_1 /TAXON_ID=420275 /ORGANISM="Attheya septentrionalis, Strain CCMP2084" /LENGTH=327 /DNA_ID=CAMNT_0043983503 /DNA_START=142 /DNA_END=1125 /DNA_ORIENTATION=+